ncbi:MAG TPA: hypothetical protein VF834_25290, partial [Streptosporangiaceae bacterium]
MSVESDEYVERYRLTWSAAGVLAADGCFVALVLWLPAPLLLRAATVAACGWSAVVTAAGVATRRVAFSAGVAGLTLGGSPLRYGA